MKDIFNDSNLEMEQFNTEELPDEIFQDILEDPIQNCKVLAELKMTHQIKQMTKEMQVKLDLPTDLKM